MNTKLLCVGTFRLGAAAGSLFTWRYAKETYARIAQEEIDSVKQVFRNRDKYQVYSDLEEGEEPVINNTHFEKEEAYIIAPEEFGEFEDYEKISLTYYSDDILADENDDPVDEFEDIVGEDFPDHFGEYEDDSVFIRNDRLKSDYEILYDSRKYSDVVKLQPH